ncbi:uncharacterized protein CC84DRAFT_1160127 [Paraphaeosphaeria sporulosa]|uniref:Uncharacterized protein n=1 Tax=Paraphaeosphaeria sporulosa TaxID=1460663 RepID=A0A177D127_9PLEO|nr:uncharacterized protein CC84DRAFT_1160127 [Paraphaeosphaeria sporulosa]OAG12872.1 hypothetical protein CC84DRAFT_1160127 [Paraphaeosphaeria sporulosa]
MCHSFSFVISHVVFVPRARLLPVHAVSYAAEQLRSGLDATKHTHRSIPGRTEPPCRSLIHLPRYGVGTDNQSARKASMHHGYKSSEICAIIKPFRTTHTPDVSSGVHLVRSSPLKSQPNQAAR